MSSKIDRCCCPPKGYAGAWAAGPCPVHQGFRAMIDKNEDAEKVNNREMGLLQFVEKHGAAPVVERQPVHLNIFKFTSDRDNGNSLFCEEIDEVAEDNEKFVRHGEYQSKLAELQATNAELSKLLGQARGMVSGASDEWHNSVEKVLGHE